MEKSLSLTTDGVEMVDYPESMKISVEHAAWAWKQFLLLPDSVKDSFAAAELQSGIGYERKGNGERESSDIKENFDVTARSLLELEQQAGTNTAAQGFIATAKALFDGVETMATTYGEHVETTYEVKGFAREAAASAPSAFIRFLRYPPVAAGTVMGEAHVDHSGFTFHLYESTGGCDRLAFDRKTWLPMPVEQGKAGVFASMQTQLFSHGKLRGLCHEISANETTSRIGRIAIVCFVPLVNMPAYDRQTHGRLQQMQPGFNYSIDPASFQQYFKKL